MSVMDALKPWMNFDLWHAVEKANKSKPATRTAYEEELRKRGASEDEIKGILDKGENESEDDEFDPPPRLVS